MKHLPMCVTAVALLGLGACTTNDGFYDNGEGESEKTPSAEPLTQP